MFGRFLAALIVVAGVSACEPVAGTNTGLTDAQIAEREAARQAREDFYRGPRGGRTGR